MELGVFGDGLGLVDVYVYNMTSEISLVSLRPPRLYTAHSHMINNLPTTPTITYTHVLWFQQFLVSLTRSTTSY